MLAYWKSEPERTAMAAKGGKGEDEGSGTLAKTVVVGVTRTAISVSGLVIKRVAPVL